MRTIILCGLALFLSACDRKPRCYTYSVLTGGDEPHPVKYVEHCR